MESEIEETDYDSAEETSSGLSTEEWEDESDSWETDNGPTTEDDSHVNIADIATPTPTPTGSTPFIIPPEESGKAGVTSPTKGATVEEGEGAGALALASPASAGGGVVVFFYTFFLFSKSIILLLGFGQQTNIIQSVNHTLI